MRMRLALPVAACAAVLAAPAAQADGFPAGQCTTWAYEMRPEIVADAALAGDKITNWNAYMWAANAREVGFSVGSTAKVGAIAVWPRHVLGAGPVGHVAFVEKVRSDGSFYVSEEDYNGSPDVHHRWIGPSSELQFIYLLPGEPVPRTPMTPGGQIEGMSSSGTFEAHGVAGTRISVPVSAPTDVTFLLTGPGIDRRVSMHVPSTSWTVGLDQIAGASELTPGSYKLTAFAYSTQIGWRWLSFTLA